VSCHTWPPKRRSKDLLVAIPSSVLSTDQTLELKTIKASTVSRALAIFRVSGVLLYSGLEDGGRDLGLLKNLLEYSLTPPHLKKKLYPVTGALRYAGLMHPLRLPNHEPPERPVVGSVLDGYVTRCGPRRCLVYLGKLGNGIIENRGFKPGTVITVSIAGVRPNGRILLEPASWGDTYTGFHVYTTSDLEESLESLKESGLLIVGATREGRCGLEALRDLATRVGSLKGLVLVIGSPRHDIFDYAPSSLFDYLVNTIPMQGTVSVRSEEAIYASLALINAFLEL